MTNTRIHDKSTHDNIKRREVTFVAKALEQRLKPPDQQQLPPDWVDVPDWDWEIEWFLRDDGYRTIAEYAATPSLASDLIRQLVMIRRHVGLALLQQDHDAAISVLQRIGDTAPISPAQLTVPFDHDRGFHRWRIMEG